MAVADGFLWVVGSHGLKRKNAKPDRDHADNFKRLAKLSLDGNRPLLACLPIEPDAKGEPCLVRMAQNGRRARRLKGDVQTKLLTRALADDPHFGPYMAIPGKDNGFDIEGLAVDGRRLLLGLRGPVLRGWSALLEIAVEARGDQLRLVPLDDSGTLIRGADLVMGGHIHLPYVMPLQGLARPLWVVQAGTAVSSRLRDGSPNSVNLLRWGADAAPGCCRIEQWDYEADDRAFRLAKVSELRPDRAGVQLCDGRIMFRRVRIFLSWSIGSAASSEVGPDAYSSPSSLPSSPP